MSTSIFDDVFRTMAQKMPRLFVGLINEAFGTAYPNSVQIEQLRNEFMEENGKIITDSIFRMGQRLYHIECQSTPDGTMAVRMLEYDFAIALEEALKNGKPYKVELPQSCVLYLRHTRNTPDELHVEVCFGEESLLYKTRVIKVQNYSKEDILKRKLCVLLPFYILKHEKAFREAAQNGNVISESVFRQINEDIYYFIDHMGEVLTETEQIDILKLMSEVMEQVLPESGEESEEVRRSMGGKVLELESERLVRIGREQGLEQGLEQGVKQERLNIIHNMIRSGNLSDREIAMYTGCSEEYVRKLRD